MLSLEAAVVVQWRTHVTAQFYQDGRKKVSTLCNQLISNLVLTFNFWFFLAIVGSGWGTTLKWKIPHFSHIQYFSQDISLHLNSNMGFGCSTEQPEQKSESSSMLQDAFDLCGTLSFYLCKRQASTICLSRHSGLSTAPLSVWVHNNGAKKKREREKKLAPCLSLIKEGGPLSPIKHSGLIWDARLERWSDNRARSEEHVWPQSHPGCLTVEERVDAFSTFIYKTSRVLPQTLAPCSDRWPDGRCITETMASLQQSDSGSCRKWANSNSPKNDIESSQRELHIKTCRIAILGTASVLLPLSSRTVFVSPWWGQWARSLLNQW